MEKVVYIIYRKLRNDPVLKPIAKYVDYSLALTHFESLYTNKDVEECKILTAILGETL